MSTRAGQTKRTRPQKHQNQSQWKANKFKTDPTTKLLETITVTNCCEKCTGVIEWKVKYGKYKPLTQPAKCVKCGEKKVKSAYQTICVPCVEDTGVCAKCGVKADPVTATLPTAAEEARLEAEFQRDLKALPERKRRTFLRALERQAQKRRSRAKKNSEDGDDDNEEEVDEDAGKTEFDLRLEAHGKLKILAEKYAKDDDFFGLDDDFDDLDLSDEDL